MSESTRPDTLQQYKERLLPVLVHIQKHLDDPLDLDLLAKIACFSPFHFHRIFRGMIGESVMEHIRRLRLERAAMRLKFSDEPVVRLALDAGYEAHETFTRAFKTLMGLTPSEYRKQHQSVAYPSTPSGVHFDPDAAIADFTASAKEECIMNVRIDKLAPAKLAFVQHIGPYDKVGDAWNKLMGWAGPRGLLGPRMRYFGLCYSDPDVTPAEKIQYQACLVVGSDVRPEGEIGVQDFDGGEYAVALHKGPYRNIGETYALICGQWLPTSGRKLGSPPSVERYLNDPRSTPEGELLTEVAMRLV